MGHHHQHVHLHNNEARQFRDAWDTFTSAVGGVFGPPPKENGPRQNADDTPGNGSGGGNGGSNGNGGGNGGGAGGSPQTVFRTVFTTMTPAGFKGGPLTTLKNGAPLTGVPVATPTTQDTDAEETADETLAQETGFPGAVETTQSSPADLAVATGGPPQVTQAAQAPANTGSANAKAGDNSAGDTAVKAGIAIGVLAGIFFIGLIILLAMRKRRKNKERQQLDDDEKINGPFGSATIHDGPIPPAKAPRLSLRPVTQFLPNLNGQNNHPDRRASRGAAIPMVDSPTANRSIGHSAWERPMTSSSVRENPFGDHAERMHSPSPQDHPPVSPISETSDVGNGYSAYSPPSVSPVNAAAAGAAAGMAAGAVGAAALTRKTSIRKDAPKALDLTLPAPNLATVPPSPAGTEFSMHSVAPGQSPGPSTSAAAIAAAGGPPTSTVHRVQLDFKPTMDDEMALHCGQLVRLLHEYDDGWALCIRLDRSQQGVVPRTCLSTRPVKPRPPPGAPRGPPVNPQGGPGGRGPNYPQGHRPMTPQGGPGYPRPQSPSRPMTAPNQGRPQSPAGRPMSPYGNRPMSPAGRSQSPGPGYQQGRPQSPNGMNRRMSPPGPSGMNQQYRPGPGPQGGPIGRKPVPGQAY